MADASDCMRHCSVISLCMHRSTRAGSSRFYLYMSV